jgi:hypothetical protein
MEEQGKKMEQHGLAMDAIGKQMDARRDIERQFAGPSADQRQPDRCAGTPAEAMGRRIRQAARNWAISPRRNSCPSPASEAEAAARHGTAAPADRAPGQQQARQHVQAQEQALQQSTRACTRLAEASKPMAALGQQMELGREQARASHIAAERAVRADPRGQRTVKHSESPRRSA